MTDDDAPKSVRYCAIIQLSKASTMQRLADVVPAMKSLLERWSKGEMEQLCRSNDGHLFGYLFRSTKPEAMFKAEFERSFATVNDDSIIIFEAGDCVFGHGFSRAWTWIQHH